MPRLARVLPCLLLASQTASADPPVDSRGYLTLNGASLLDRGDVSFGLGALEWGRRPTAAVNDAVSATLVGAIGLRLGPVPLELGASMPFTIASAAAGGRDEQGVGDAGFHGKLGIARGRRFGLAAIGSVYAPTSSVGGDRTSQQVLGVVDAQLGRLRLGLSGGVRRTSVMGSPSEMTDATVAPVGVAAAWAVAPDKFDVVGEVTGSFGFGPMEGRNTLEALGGVKLYLAKNSYLSLALGRGLTDATTADYRALIGIVFEPKAAARRGGRVEEPRERPVEREPVRVAVKDFPDRDNDGIRDDLDKCPDDPENYNMFEDDDGCPDDDRDALVALLDVDDPCRVDPDKCSRNRVILKKTSIVTLDSIEFEYDKAIIRPISFPTLDAVVQSLVDNPEINLVEIRGHTDERGDDGYNLDLSERRAKAVLGYLTSKGIDTDRLTSTGYGEKLPLDPRHDEAAWAKNRRVEFQIRKRGGKLP